MPALGPGGGRRRRDGGAGRRFLGRVGASAGEGGDRHRRPRAGEATGGEDGGSHAACGWWWPPWRGRRANSRTPAAAASRARPGISHISDGPPSSALVVGAVLVVVPGAPICDGLERVRLAGDEAVVDLVAPQPLGREGHRDPVHAGLLGRLGVERLPRVAVDDRQRRVHALQRRAAVLQDRHVDHPGLARLGALGRGAHSHRRPAAAERGGGQRQEHQRYCDQQAAHGASFPRTPPLHRPR